MALARAGGMLVALVGVLAASGLSLAQGTEDLITQGIALRKENRDQEALPLFRKAFEQQPTPRAAGQLGTCEQALGLWVEAEKHIQQALKHPGDPWVQKSEAALRSALAHVQQRLGSIEVWGSPAGARVTIDGEVVGTLPMKQAARSPVGQRSLSADAAGFRAESRIVDVQPGALVREHVVLRSIGAVATASVTPPMPAPNPDPPPPVSPILKADDSGPPAATAIHKTWWFWTIVGTVAVAAGASVYFLATRNDDCQAPMGGTCTTF